VVHAVVTTAHVEECGIFDMSFGGKFALSTGVGLVCVLHFVVHDTMHPAVADAIVCDDVIGGCYCSWFIDCYVVLFSIASLALWYLVFAVASLVW